jgi:hypothetical protein
MSWEKGSATAERWRIRFGRDKDELQAKPWNVVKGSKASLRMPTEGKFLFEAQALDSTDTILAATKIKQVTILPPPPLEAPEFVDFDNKLKKANTDGSIKVKWREIENALGYVIFLHDPKRQGETKYEERSTSLQLKGLNPGKYRIQILTVNERGEHGKMSEARYIEVPNTSNIAAPKVNSIKVH